jgi:hypothetical protein
MGFPHDKTTHHFHLRGDGGTIEVSANDPKDQRNIAAIRSHLSHIAQLFAGGDFTTPMSIHETVPPGAASMRLLKSAITYEYEQNASGGQVRIVSKDAVAIAAIHDFLRFQITEHETGDSPDVQNAH